MSRVKAVVFDIGNVLLRWDPHSWFAERIGPERTEAFFAQSGILAANDRVDHGDPFADTILNVGRDNPHWAKEAQMWHDNWLALASPDIPHSVRLLRALRAKGIPVFALSNFGIETYEIARPHYPFLDEFDRAWISGHLGVIKPAARIYEILEEESGVDPSALLFADDRADNIAAAEARGWLGHLFTTPQGWADRLVAEGLLTESEAA